MIFENHFINMHHGVIDYGDNTVFVKGNPFPQYFESPMKPLVTIHFPTYVFYKRFEWGRWGGVR